MIHSLSQRLSKKLAAYGVFEDSKIEVYAYGYELLLSTAINILLVLIIGILLGIVREALLYIITFAVLRSYTGGYHANTHMACITIFTASFLVCALLLRIFPSEALSPPFLLLGLLPSVVIFLKAPIEAINKPLSDAKRSRLSKICKSISILNAAFLTSASLLPSLRTSLVFTYFMGVFAVSVSLITAILTKGKEVPHSEKDD